MKEYRSRSHARREALPDLRGTSQIQRLVIARTSCSPARRRWHRDRPGRVALVTGGSRGLDERTPRRARRGDVASPISRSIGRVRAYRGRRSARAGGEGPGARRPGADGAEIQELGRRSAAIKCDVTDREVAATVASAVDELGSIDILVNNAGTLDHVGQLGDQTLELRERDLRANLTGAFNCSQEVWSHMVEREVGPIVNMASVAGTLGGFGQASYWTTKAGLIGLDEDRRSKAHGTASPRTPSSPASSPRRCSTREPGDERAHDQADGDAGPGEPSDIAHAIAFLCSTSPATSPASSSTSPADRALHLQP